MKLKVHPRSAIAAGLLEAAQTSGPGPHAARLEQAAQALEHAAAAFDLIERMVSDGDPGIAYVIGRAREDLAVSS